MCRGMVPTVSPASTEGLPIAARIFETFGRAKWHGRETEPQHVGQAAELAQTFGQARRLAPRDAQKFLEKESPPSLAAQARTTHRRTRSAAPLATEKRFPSQLTKRCFPRQDSGASVLFSASRGRGSPAPIPRRRRPARSGTTGSTGTRLCPPTSCCPDDYARKPFPLIPCPPANCSPDDYCRKPFPLIPCLPRCGGPDDYCRKLMPYLLCPPLSPYLQCGPAACPARPAAPLNESGEMRRQASGAASARRENGRRMLGGVLELFHGGLMLRRSPGGPKPLRSLRCFRAVFNNRSVLARGAAHGGVAGGGGSLVALDQPADDVVEHRRQEDAEERHAEHAAEDGRAERPPHLGPGPRRRAPAAPRRG